MQAPDKANSRALLHRGPNMRKTDLTPREEEVVFLAGQGLTDNEIGEKLGIRPNTVAGHWLRMRLKLNAPSRTAVAALYAETKATELVAEQESLRSEVTLRKEAETELRKAQSQLEVRVRRRTAELEEANERLREEIAARERLQLELAAGRDRLATAIDATGIDVFEIDVASKTVNRFWAREGAAENVTVSLSAFARQLEAVCHPDDYDRIRTIVAGFGEASAPKFEVEWRHSQPDGSFRRVLTKGVLVCGNDGSTDRLVGCHIDVSDTKRLEEQRQRFFRDSSDFLAILSPDGRYREVNPAGLQALGYTAEELSELSLLDLTHPEDLAAVEGKWAWLVSVGSTEAFDHRARRKDGSYACLMATATIGSDGSIFVVSKDVTDRRLAEAAVQESETKFRRLFEESFDGLFVTSPDGRILDMNRKGIEMFGYANKDEVLALDLARDVYASPEDRHKVLAMVGRQGSGEYEVAVKKKNGEIMDTYCSLVAERNAAGDIVSYRGIIRDVTAKKRAETALRESEQRFRQVFDNVTDSLFLLEAAEDGRYIVMESNPAHEALTGLPAAQLRGRSLDEIFAGEAIGNIVGMIEECVSDGRSISVETELDFPTGPRSFRAGFAPIVDDAGSVKRVVVVAHDTTDQTMDREA